MVAQLIISIAGLSVIADDHRIQLRLLQNGINERPRFAF